MCSNISTDTTRSKREASAAKTFMSQVTMRTFWKPRLAHSPSMWARCEAELETPVMRAFGYFSAIQRVSEPQPQPSSRISRPSLSSARAQVRASMVSSASPRVSPPSS